MPPAGPNLWARRSRGGGHTRSGDRRRLFVLAQTYRQVAVGSASDALSGVPLLPGLVHPERWLLWLGVIFVASVYLFPGGILRDQQEAERLIRFLEHHDALTELPNRLTFGRALIGSLGRARADGRSIAVLCIDLDHFKDVNDIHGHAGGDEVLVEAARRMLRVVGESDLLARVGGDEFALIQTTGEQPRAATLLASRLIEVMQADFEVAGSRIVVGLSIGLTIGPDDGTGPERLLANADTALYRAKSEGRGRFLCFEPEMDLRVRERHELAAELRRAIARDELVLL